MATKDSQLPSAATVALTDKVRALVDGANAMVPLSVLQYEVRGYKVYTALLTQTGTDAPVATVLENTLGGTVVWAYANTGEFTATLAAAFVENKTAILMNSTIDMANGAAVNATWASANVINLVSFDGDTNANGILSNSTIEIRVYP